MEELRERVESAIALATYACRGRTVSAGYVADAVIEALKIDEVDGMYLIGWRPDRHPEF